MTLALVNNRGREVPQSLATIARGIAAISIARMPMVALVRSQKPLR